jgi:transketolase
MTMNKGLRKRVVEMGNKMSFGHYCSAMSCIDVCAYLYDNILTRNDVFIMAKGHGIIAVLPILEKMGKNVQWKPYLDYDPVNGIEATTGSLGHGLPIAVGRAYAKRGKGRVFCMVGDGEIQEGSNWEALSIASQLKLNNLIVLVDWNKYQAVSSVESIHGITGKVLTDRLTAFGCQTWTVKGHDEKDLKYLDYIAETYTACPKAVILDTVKGKGISYLENNPSFHVIYWHEHPKEYEETMMELS